MKTLPPRLVIVLVLVSFDAAAADVESGRRLFEQHCSECHGPGPGHPGTQRLGWTRGEARSQLERRTDLKAEYITAVVRNGLLEMPPFRPAQINDTELQEITGYLTRPGRR